MANIHISNGEAGPSSDSLKPMVLTSSASFKARKKPTISRAGSEVEDVINLLHGSDPVRVELNRLENEVRGNSSFFFYRLFSRKISVDKGNFLCKRLFLELTEETQWISQNLWVKYQWTRNVAFIIIIIFLEAFARVRVLLSFVGLITAFG